MEISASINGTEYPVYNMTTFSERLDEEMDSGSVQIICDKKDPFPDYTFVRITLSDDDNNPKTYDFYLFDNVEQRRGDYYVHTLELVELTRLLMGVMIDGKAVTQPIEGSGENKKNLYQVVYELVRTVQLLKADGVSAVGQRFSIDDTSKWLEEINSPEFHWSAGTLLWECLCDIGNVIDCIPRVKIGSNNKLYVTFDKINDVTGEYEL